MFQACPSLTGIIKALAKYAQLVLVACDVLKDQELTRSSLEKLKAAVNRFATNKQKYGLVYESEILLQFNHGGYTNTAGTKANLVITDFSNLERDCLRCDVSNR